MWIFPTPSVCYVKIDLSEFWVPSLAWVWSAGHNNNNCFTALCPGLPRWASTRRNVHPPTILIIIQSLSASSIYYDPYHRPCSNCVLGNLFAQPLSTSFLVYLLVWSPPPHIPYISSPCGVQEHDRIARMNWINYRILCFVLVNLLASKSCGPRNGEVWSVIFFCCH